MAMLVLKQSVKAHGPLVWKGAGNKIGVAVLKDVKEVIVLKLVVFRELQDLKNDYQWPHIPCIYWHMES